MRDYYAQRQKASPPAAMERTDKISSNSKMALNPVKRYMFHGLGIGGPGGCADISDEAALDFAQELTDEFLLGLRNLGTRGLNYIRANADKDHHPLAAMGLIEIQ